MINRRRDTVPGRNVSKRTIVAVSVMELFFAVASAEAQTQPAIAQSQPAPAADQVQPQPPAAATPVAKDGGSNTVTLNSVEVTANRRREPAREVPMKVNTLSSESLQKAGATQLSDYVTSQPGVSFDSGGGPGQGTISIRGVTTGEDVGPTVGVYVDDAPLGSSTVYGGGAGLAVDMGLLDLNHIEILFGPQGTLYGAGAMGGLLKYVTNKPDTEAFSGQVGTSFSSTWHGGLNNTTSAILNIPLKQDVAAIRLSAFNNHDGGYVDAIGNEAGSRINRGDTTGMRASVLVTPTDKLTFRFTATVQDINNSGLNYVDYGANGKPLYGDLTRNLGSSEAYHQSIQFYTADVEYDFGWARLNSVSSFQSSSISYPNDYTSIYVPVFNAQGMNFNAASIDFDVSTNKYTQEFRLTSPANQRIEWVAGLYYNHEVSNNNEQLQATSPGSNAYQPLERFGIGSSYKEYAAYGDLTYNLTPRIALTAGVRVAHNEQTYDQSTTGPLVQTPVDVHGTSSDTSKTYMFTAAYKLTQTSNVYARIASGYRPGGPNDVAISPITGLPLAGKATFLPDTLWNYEVGYKADLLDKKLSFSLAAYDIEWHNIQQFSAVQGFSQLVNAGNARVKGLELSSVFRPTPSWTFSAALSATDGYLTSGDPGTGSKAGDPLPNTAKFSATVSADYNFRIATHPAYVGVSERYISQRHASFADNTQVPDFIMPAYAVTDLQAGIDLKHVNLAFFVRNLFNREGILSANTQNVPIGGDILATVIQPRTIGVRLTAPF